MFVEEAHLLLTRRRQRNLGRRWVPWLVLGRVVVVAAVEVVCGCLCYTRIRFGIQFLCEKWKRRDKIKRSQSSYSFFCCTMGRIGVNEKFRLLKCGLSLANTRRFPHQDMHKFTYRK